MRLTVALFRTKLCSCRLALTERNGHDARKPSAAPPGVAGRAWAFFDRSRREAWGDARHDLRDRAGQAASLYADAGQDCTGLRCAGGGTAGGGAGPFSVGPA